MSTCFDQWEKDPFFPAAEEVQESTDRMESVFRRWIHERRDNSNPAGAVADPSNVSGDLRRELHTALGTAKWQLEELERVVRLNDETCSVGEDTRSRHNQFFEVIGSQISTIEKTLKTSNLAEGKPQLSWVQLDEGERDELALFLSAPFLQQGSLPPLPPIGENRRIDGRKESTRIKGENHADPGKNNCHSNELDQSEAKEAKMQGHRRTASASADIEAWKISVFNESELPNYPPPKTPSFSCLTRALESTSKKKWPKNGFRKWKGGDQLQEAEMIPLHNNQISQGLNACYERSKSCLSSCDDYYYNKQLYGWLGVLHRQLQRSQYQIQYGRPILMILWVVGIVFLITIFTLRAI